MKNIFLTMIATLAFSAVCNAQVTHIAESIKVSLPNGAYKMNKQQINSLSDKKSSLQIPEELKAPYVYNINGIILNIYNVSHDSTNISLGALKKSSDNLSLLLKRHGNNTYTSIIKSFGNNEALITNSIVNSIGNYRFTLKNPSKKWTFWGVIEYPATTSAQAAALLDDILNNAQFTQ